MEILYKTELQQVALSHSLDIDRKDLWKMSSLSSLVNDTTLPSDNPLRLRKNLLK